MRWFQDTVCYSHIRNNRVTGRDLPRKGYPPGSGGPVNFGVAMFHYQRVSQPSQLQWVLTMSFSCLEKDVYILSIVCIYIYTYIYISYIVSLYHIYKHIYIWVTYNISLTWIKAILGWFPLRTMIIVRSQWGRSEVVIIYPYIYIYI